MTSTVIVIFVLNTKYKQMNIIIKEGNKIRYVDFKHVFLIYKRKDI
jgi:hypothetical protein